LTVATPNPHFRDEESDDAFAIPDELLAAFKRDNAKWNRGKSESMSTE
jgi:hypothetical protein